MPDSIPGIETATRDKTGKKAASKAYKSEVVQVHGFTTAYILNQAISHASN